MNFPSIDIQGSILSLDLLAKIRGEQATFQQGKDFHPDLTNARLKDEISLAWQEAKGQWAIFKSKLTRLKEGETGTTETRNFWISPLLTNLGYNLTYNRQSEELNGKSFPIGYRDSNLDNFPVYVGGYHESLDKRPENKLLRVSPHAMLQEYLNYSEHLYGLVTNGRHLRLLRDASRITRLSYAEFNLEKMMEEDLYSDFVILYRVVHASRMPRRMDGGADSIIEKYHQEGLEAGSTIRSKLGEAVKGAIRNLANGFINHPANTALRDAVESGNFDSGEYYRHQLRIIYRLLFLFVIEERNLVYADSKTPETKRLSQIYFNYFSLARLRKLAKKHLPPEASRHHDLWQGLISTFSLFERKEMGEKLGIMALQGDLFGYHALSGNGYDLHHCCMSNAVLLNIVKSLGYFENDNGVLIAVNYGGLDVEEFGSVYEGLLELKLEVRKIEGSDQFSCSFDTSNERGKSGSHYTPEELVQPLIKHSLEYLIQERVASGEWRMGKERMVSGEWQMEEGKERVVSGEWRMGKGEDRMVSGEWQMVYGMYPAIQTNLKNLIINLSLQYEKLSGFGSMAKGNGFSSNDLPINQLLSQRRIVWDDFSTPQVSKFYTGKHSRGLGQKQQQGIHPLPEHSQGQLDGNRNTSDAGGKNQSLQAGTDSTHAGAFSNAEQAIAFLTTVHLSQKQLAQIWNLLPPAIRHSLFTTHHLLNLKIADVACGSGHILLSAARRLSLEIARVQTEEEQPNPVAIRKTMKDVVRNCIYGVDKNPLAVELCKIALWLEAYNPGEPLNFLDHHIKCGDAIVGLAHRDELEKGIADEAFKTLPGDDKEIAKTLRDKNQKERKERAANGLQLNAEFEKSTENSVQESMAEYKTFSQLPETTPDEIERKAKTYQKFNKGKGFTSLKALADAQVAQFFIPKTEANKETVMTDGEYSLILSGHRGWQDRKVAKATAIAQEQRFFHWFLEFPEVFQDGGFDCVLGNPPFLGGQKLSGSFGEAFLEFIKYQFSPIGAVDLVTYFFRRVFTIIRQGGFLSLISTNTIAQGKAREHGLDVIVNQGGTINYAIKSTKWPGLAAVEVALVSITKQIWKGKFILAGKEVKTITPYLDDADTFGNAFPLKQNEDKSFQGSIILGKGFVLTSIQAQALIAKNPKNRDVLFPYLNGDDLNSNPDQHPSRWVINFHDWPLDRYTADEWDGLDIEIREIISQLFREHKYGSFAPPFFNDPVASDYSDCLEIVEKLVKPERIAMKGDRGAEYWWQFLRIRNELYRNIDHLERVLVITRIGKYMNFSISAKMRVFADSCVVLSIFGNKIFGLFQSNIHESWAWKNCTTLESRINYTPGTIFETFPLPIDTSQDQETKLEYQGEQYHTHRKHLLTILQLGLTKTYNAFHAPEIQLLVKSDTLQELNKQSIEKLYGKEVWSLWNHLQKTPGTCPIEEAIAGIVKLRELHVQMDEAVLEAYGWRFDSAQRPDIQLRHDFYEVDYLPENDRIRYTIHPEARKEVLKRLLELNHKIHAEEVAAGLWDKKTKSLKTQPNQAPVVEEPQAGYGDLFSS